MKTLVIPVELGSHIIDLTLYGTAVTVKLEVNHTDAPINPLVFSALEIVNDKYIQYRTNKSVGANAIKRPAFVLRILE